MSEIGINDIQEIRAWAHRAGTIALSYFNRVSGTRKADQSMVTEADVEIETFLRKQIQERYPDHGVMGEEQGIAGIEQEYVWSLDPLDGTESFLAGLPIWAVSIGLLRHQAPYLGVIYLPTTDCCYWNDLDGNAYRNDGVIHVSSATALDGRDWIAVPSNAHIDYTITFPSKTRSLGSIAAHCCYVARNSTPGSLIDYPHLWDIAAGMAIVDAAGGVMVTLRDGAPLDIRPLLDGSRTQQPVIICAPALRNDMLRSITVRRTLEERVRQATPP